MHTEQPIPTKNNNPSIQHQVAAEIINRADIGKERYGTYLQAFNGRKAARDFFEELLDGLVYFKQHEEEMKVIGERLSKVYGSLVLAYHFSNNKESWLKEIMDELKEILNLPHFALDNTPK